MAASAELVALWCARHPTNADVSRVAEVVQALCVAARTRHPSLGVDDATLIAAVARHAGSLDEAATLRIDELALAVAAATGVPGAVATIESAYAATLKPTFARFAGRGHSADDLRQVLRVHLFVAEAGVAPTIAEYNGKGSLGTWLRVVATRQFIDLGRRKDRAREALDDTLLASAVATSDLPLEAIKSEYREVVRDALVAATRALAPGDRHLLRQSLVEGLSIDQIGALLGIHRATAARRLARARELLADRTREVVTERLGLDAHELGDVVGKVISKLDVTLRTLLATPSPDRCV